MYITRLFLPKYQTKGSGFLKNQIRNCILKIGFYSLCVVLLMCVSFFVSYKIVKQSALSKRAESAPNVHDENFDANKPFPNLPVTLSGTYEEDEEFKSENFDYLVIAENNLVNLYAIDNDDKKTFERILEIDLAALKEEDRNLLKKGIILNDRASVLSLIEDYSS